MQPLASPITGGKKRHCNFRPEGRASFVIIIIERMARDLAAKITSVSCQLFFGEHLGSTNKLAGNAAARAALAESVLHRLNLHVVPVSPEAAENASVMRHVTIPVSRAFPNAHRGQVRRLERRHLPLVDRIVGDAVEADLAVAPWLDSGPLDAVVKIFSLARREMIDVTRRAAAASRIYAYANVTIRHPLLRIDDFPVLIFIGRACYNVRVLRGYALPLVRITVLKGKPFRVGAVAEDDRILTVHDRVVDIGAKDEAVVHRDRQAPVDLHAVPSFGSMLHCSNCHVFIRSSRRSGPGPLQSPRSCRTERRTAP